MKQIVNINCIQCGFYFALLVAKGLIFLSGALPGAGSVTLITERFISIVSRLLCRPETGSVCFFRSNKLIQLL